MTLILSAVIIPIVMGAASYGMWITMYPGQALHWLRRILAWVIRANEEDEEPEREVIVKPREFLPLEPIRFVDAAEVPPTPEPETVVKKGPTWREIIAKPLYTCQRCMVSVWGLSFCYVLGLLVHQEQAVIRFVHLDFTWWLHDARALAMLPVYCVLAVCVHGKLIGE